MKSTRRPSISRRLTFSLIFAAVMVSTASCAVNYYINMKNAEVRLEQKADEFISLAADALRVPLWSLHTDSIHAVGTSYAQNEFITQIQIYDSLDNLIFNSSKKDGQAPVIERSREVYYKKEIMGKVYLKLSSARYQANLNQLLTASVISALAILAVLIVFTGSFLRLFLGKPLQALSKRVKDYAAGAAPLPPGNSMPKEFEQFILVLNDMGLTIDRQMENLKLAEKKYRGLIETLNDCVWETDAKGVYTYVSPKFEELLGYQPEQMLGRKRIDFMPTQLADRAGADFDQVISCAVPVSGIEATLLDASGNWVLIEYNGVPIFDESGKILGIRGVDRDISERKAKETAERNREKAEAAAKARSVFLDNSGQGFLSFGADLVVKPEYSRECMNIFGKPIGGEHIAKLLVPDDDELKNILADNYRKAMAADALGQELILTLLKKDFGFNKKFVEAEYRIVGDVMLLILTDVTRRRQLENEILNERNRLNFVVSTVRETSDFRAILHEFDLFCKQGIPSLLAQAGRSGPNDPSGLYRSLAEAYRQIHTFKGLFAQQNFLSLPKALHKAEAQLARMQKNPGESVPRFRSFLETFDLSAFLEKDLAIIKEFLGQDFLKQEGEIAIPRKQIDRIEKMACKLLQQRLDDLADNQILELIQRIREIRQLKFKSLLSSYPGYTLELAGRLEKKIAPFKINGEDIMVDPDRFMPFSRTLVHVFRNAVDHGIEPPEERLDAGKDEKGNIQCHVGLKDGWLCITVADDGRGIDVENLRKSAVSRGLFTAQKAEMIPDREIRKLIFSMDFSTRDKVTDLSGRGVGLSAVYTEIEKIGGKIDIASAPGLGCKIHFSIPLNEQSVILPA